MYTVMLGMMIIGIFTGPLQNMPPSGNGSSLVNHKVRSVPPKKGITKTFFIGPIKP